MNWERKDKKKKEWEKGNTQIKRETCESEEEVVGGGGGGEVEELKYVKGC